MFAGRGKEFSVARSTDEKLEQIASVSNITACLTNTTRENIAKLLDIHGKCNGSYIVDWIHFFNQMLFLRYGRVYNEELPLADVLCDIILSMDRSCFFRAYMDDSIRNYMALQFSLFKQRQERAKQDAFSKKSSKESYTKDGLKKDSVENEDPKKETVMKEDPNKETVMKEDPKKEVVIEEDPKKETVMKEDPKKEVVIEEDPKNQEEKKKQEESKKEDTPVILGQSDYISSFLYHLREFYNQRYRKTRDVNYFEIDKVNLVPGKIKKIDMTERQKIMITQHINPHINHGQDISKEVNTELKKHVKEVTKDEDKSLETELKEDIEKIVNETKTTQEANTVIKSEGKITVSSTLSKKPTEDDEIIDI